MVNNADHGISAALFFGIVSHIVARNKLSKGINPGLWATAWKSLYWLTVMLFLGNSFIIQSGPNLMIKGIFIFFLIALGTVCWMKYQVSEGWRIGFWFCLVFGLPNSIHLLIHLVFK